MGVYGEAEVYVRHLEDQRRLAPVHAVLEAALVERLSEGGGAAGARLVALEGGEADAASDSCGQVSAWTWGTCGGRQPAPATPKPIRIAVDMEKPELLLASSAGVVAGESV